jgi:hypothetical protein
MRKNPSTSMDTSPRGRLAGSGWGRRRFLPDEGVTITSGAAVPRIDLDQMFETRGMTVTAAAAPVIGGGLQAQPGKIAADDTVSLNDGTKITFASVHRTSALESVS